MKKLSLYLVVLSLLTALLPATMASASAPWFDIEAESGTLTHPIGKITDGNAASASNEQYVASTLYNCAGNSTLLSFSCDEEKEYDIWAVVGVFNGDYLGKYQFTLDETDVIYEKNLISAYNDAVGDSIYTSIDLSGAGHRTEMKWVKIASSKTISIGDHTLLAAAVAAGTGNKAGAFDVVRFVPSDWEWAPTGANFDAPEDMSTPGGDDDDDTPVGYVHMEAEDAEYAEGTYTVSNRDEASNGKALIPVDGITSAETALEFNVTIPETQQYDVYALVAQKDFSSSAWRFLIDGTNYNQEMSEGAGEIYKIIINLGYPRSMQWVKIAGDVDLAQGSTTIVANIPALTHASSGSWLTAIDAIRLVPSSWDWVADNTLDAPEDMSTPGGDDDVVVGEWFDIEAESGTLGNAIGEVTDSYAASASNERYVVSTLYNCPGNSTLMSFSCDEEKEYDIWAVVGVFNGDYLGKYQFTLDETDVIYEKNLIEAYREAEGDSIYTSTDLSGAGHTTEMKWVKIASSKTISTGDHTLLAAAVAAGTGNRAGAFDVVRFVPSDWEWAPTGANFDAPEDMSTPGGGENEGDEIGEWFDIEVEDGEYDGTLLTSNADGRDSFYTVQGTVSANKTTSSFTLDEEKTYDVWAVVGTHSNGHNLCNYTFSLDDTVLGTISAGVPTYNADAALYTGKMVAGGHSVTMVWAKVKDDVTIDADTHSLVAEISACVNGNKLGQIDVVRFVPSDWEWIPEANFDDPEDMSTPGGGGETPSPEPGEAVTSETGIFWMESTAAEFNSNVWRTVTNANASGGTLLDAGNENADDIEDYEIVYSFETEEEMVCDVWALVHDMAAHNSSYTFTLDDIGLTSSGYGSGTYTSSSTVYGGYSHSMTWQKVADTRIIEAGEHTFVVAPKKSSLFANRILAAVDCVVVIPTSLRWKPDVAGANVELPNASIGRLAAEYIKNNFFSGDYTRVADNIALPEIRTIAGAAITYECDNADVISADGVVSRPYFNAEDANVNYSICATINGVVTKVAVPMTVLKNSKYTVSEFEVSEEIAAGQAFTASADVNVNVSADSEITGKASLIIALYDTNGALEGIAMDGDVINSRTNTLEASLDMPENVAGKTVKVFLVNDLKMGNQLIDTVVVD